MSLFSECLAKVPNDINIEVDLSFDIASRIDAILTQKGISQKKLACMLGKRESEISKWLKGSHNFTLRTIAKITNVLNEPIIQIPNLHEDEYSHVDVKFSLVLPSCQNKAETFHPVSGPAEYNIVNLNKKRKGYDC